MNHNKETIMDGKMTKERIAFDEWFEAHFADWLRAMRGGFRHDDIQQFRDSLLTAWSAALRGQASGAVPEDAEARWVHLKRRLTDESTHPWTVAEAMNYRGFFMHGWTSRGKASSSRVAGEGQTIIDESELVALRCINDAVQIIGDQASETRNVNWAVVRDAKQRLRSTKGAP